ncbi:MAG: glycosyltransferase family 2 protein [Chloroflexi bacterium]|nr:glycosyltransferase family 2 protein [Chloroflexota bacterium]
MTDALRARAAAVSAGALLAGAAAGRSQMASRLTLAAAASVPAIAVALVAAGRSARAASRRRDDRPGPVAGLPRLGPPSDPGAVLVVVPARDEASVVPDVIADLSRQDLRTPDGRLGFEVRLIDDRSTDGTGRVARAAIAALGIGDRAGVVRRGMGPSGKGAALAACVPALAPDDLVIVLDADARVGEGFVRRVAAAAHDGQPAVTARRRMLLPAGSSRRARLLRMVQDDEETLDGAIQSGRWRLGGGSEFRGNGMALRGAALSTAGGWPATALCEDLELSTSVFLGTGIGVRWLEDIEVWEQPVTDVADLLRQRLRWAEGAVLRDLRLVLPRLVDRQVPLRGRFDLAAYAAQTLLGVFLLGTFMGGAGRRRRNVILGVAAAYGVGAFGLAFDALERFDDGQARGAGAGPRAVRSGALVAFALLWLVLTPVAWLRIALRSERPVHQRTPKGPGYWRPVG